MTDIVTKVSIGGQVVPIGGGSEGQEVVYLTQAEYDALPASKLTDGKIYKVKTTGVVPGGSADASDVEYDNTTSGLTADNVQDAIDELKHKQDTGGGSMGGLGDVATVGFFANASGGNFGLLNNTDEYTTNSGYNTNRADNTQTGDGELSISVTSPSFAEKVNSINKYNVILKVAGISNDNTKMIRPNGNISDQAKADIIPAYGKNINYIGEYEYVTSEYQHRFKLSTIDNSGNIINTYNGPWTGSDRYYPNNYGVWTNSSYVRYPILDGTTVRVIGPTVSQYGATINAIAVGGNGKYVYTIGTRSGNDPDYAAITIGVIDTENETGSVIKSTNSACNNISYKLIEVGNKFRVYFYQYFSEPTRDYQGGWFEVNKDTATAGDITSMTYDEVSTFISSHPYGEYDSFDDLNLLTNLDATSDGKAYFNGEVVGLGYFKRMRDNKKQEYSYSNDNIIVFSDTDGYINLKVGGDIVNKFSMDNKGWGVIETGTNITISSEGSITTSNTNLTLEAKGLGVSGNITIQPTTNGLTDTGSIFTKTNNATWMELGVEGYEYNSGGDIIYSGSLTTTYTDINGDFSKYSLVVYQFGATNGYSTYSFIPKYLPSGEITMNSSVMIKEDRTQIKSNSGTKQNFIMIGYL